MEYYSELTKLFEGPDGDLFKPKQKPAAMTADDRLISSFEEITKFVKMHNRLPDANSDDIVNEARLAHRLDSIKSNKDKIAKISEYDELGLLSMDPAPSSLDELFAHDADLFGGREGLFYYGNAPSLARRTVVNDFTPERRKKCKDFDKKYRRLFVEQQEKLRKGDAKLTPFKHIDQLVADKFYVYGGQMCYVESFGERERKAGGYHQQRIEVIFENGLESNMYKRSLAQRLYEGGAVVTDATRYGDDATGASAVSDSTVGHIYVLESLSQDPAISTIANLYKIGCTKNSVAERIANAANEATYLMAPVELVDDYRLTGLYDIHKVETLIHHFFVNAKVDIEIVDANGKKCVPDEWYSVPLGVIREAIDMIDSGEIVEYMYDVSLRRIVERH